MSGMWHITGPGESSQDEPHKHTAAQMRSPKMGMFSHRELRSGCFFLISRTSNILLLFRYFSHEVAETFQAHNR